MAILPSCACHGLWRNSQDWRPGAWSLRGGLPVWWGLRRSTAVQYALTWKDWPKAPWRGRLRGGTERGLACLQERRLEQADLNRKVPGAETDHRSSMISQGGDDSDKIWHFNRKEDAAPARQSPRVTKKTVGEWVKNGKNKSGSADVTEIERRQAEREICARGVQ